MVTSYIVEPRAQPGGGQRVPIGPITKGSAAEDWRLRAMKAAGAGWHFRTDGLLPVMTAARGGRAQPAFIL